MLRLPDHRYHDHHSTRVGHVSRWDALLLPALAVVVIMFGFGSGHRHTVRPGGPVVVALQAHASPTHVSVRYALVAPARVALSVRPPHGRPTIVGHSAGRPGLGRITWNRRLHQRSARHGTYRLTIIAQVGHTTARSARSVRL
jgi:hypothetical protein